MVVSLHSELELTVMAFGWDGRCDGLPLGQGRRPRKSRLSPVLSMYHLIESRQLSGLE